LRGRERSVRQGRAQLPNQLEKRELVAGDIFYPFSPSTLPLVLSRAPLHYASPCHHPLLSHLTPSPPATEIGLGLTCAGVLFLVLGVMLFFDKGLLAMGNILFLAGVSLIIGPRGVFRFFFQKRKVRGTSCFLGGIFLVLVGWPVFGAHTATQPPQSLVGATHGPRGGTWRHTCISQRLLGIRSEAALSLHRYGD